jgi:hypothetical protein
MKYKFKLKHPSNRALVFVVVVIIGLEAGILWYFGGKIQILWNDVQCQGQSTNPEHGQPNFNPSASCLGNLPVLHAAQSAVASMYFSEPIPDAKENKVYIPELKIYLPLTVVSRSLVYTYFQGDSTMPEAVSFNNKQLTSAMLQNFNDIKCRQNFVELSVNGRNDPNTYGMSYNTSVKLSDGRIFYIFSNKNDCSNVWTDNISPNAIINVLKQAKPY